MASITSANAVLMISVVNLFDAPQRLEQFSADDIYDIDPQETAETAMGVDGHLTGGFVHTPTVQKISFMADSPSIELFERWIAAQREMQDTLVANMQTTLASVNRKFTHTRGFLSNAASMPSARKVLQPRVFEIRWQRVTPAPNSGF